MSKSTKIFIGIFIIIGIITAVYFLFSNKAPEEGGEPTETLYDKFNPFGSPTDVNDPEDTTDPENPTGIEPEVENTNLNLRQITTFAIAGGTYFDFQRKIPEPDKEVDVLGAANQTTTKADLTKTIPKFETIPAIRYVQRATRHIFQLDLDNDAIGKISNTTIPSIYEVIFNGPATSVIYRYLSGDKTITSYMATLGTAKGEFLPEDIVDISTSRDKAKMFYLVKTKNGVTGYIKTFITGKSTQVFSHAFSEWLSQYITDKKMYLTTKPSSSVPGQLYSLNVATGAISKIFGGVLGLTTLANHDGSTVLFGASEATGPRIGIFNPADRSTKLLEIYGLPEKCVWSKDNITVYCGIPKRILGTEFPESWYQGIVSFEDYFVKINTKTLSVITIENGNGAPAFDATDLFLDSEEGIIFFTNKKDGTLWSLKM